MIRQARTSDTVLVRSREMADRTQTLRRGGGGGEGVKTTENKIHWPRWLKQWQMRTEGVHMKGVIFLVESGWFIGLVVPVQEI